MDIQNYLRAKMAEHELDSLEVKIHAVGFAMASANRGDCWGMGYQFDGEALSDDELVERAVRDLVKRELEATDEVGADAA